MKAVINHLSKWCAYTHIFRVLSALLHGKDISDQTRVGRNIALLGIFCPLFWYALLTGASKQELTFHATHSGIVFMIGIVIMFAGMKQKKGQ